MKGEKVQKKDVKFSSIECRDGDNRIKKIDTENCLLRKIRKINLGNICHAIVISTFVNFLSLLETFIGMPINNRGFFAYLRLIINILLYILYPFVMKLMHIKKVGIFSIKLVVFQ